LLAGEQIDLFAAETLLEFGEWDSASVTPADDFAVEDEIADDAADRLEEFGEFGDAVEGAGVDFDLRVALVNLGADAIELVFDQGAVGERGDEIGRSFRGAGQHDGDGAEELERDGGKFVGHGEADDIGDIAEEHVGALDGRERLIEGFGDGFFDEAFFQADAQLAGGDFDEIFGFEGGEALERVFEKGLLRGWAALLRERGKNFGDLRKTERRPHRVLAENFFGAGAEIAVMAKNRSELTGILICDLGDRAKENREANGENALFAAGENAAAQVESGEAGLVDQCSAEKVGHQADFFVLFGGSGDGFAELGEAEHSGRPVSHGGDAAIC